MMRGNGIQALPLCVRGFIHASDAGYKLYLGRFGVKVIHHMMLQAKPSAGIGVVVVSIGW
jgi:hypothetical protein